MTGFNDRGFQTWQSWEDDASERLFDYSKLASGRLKGKQIVIAAMRKLLVLCFGVLKTGKEFDPAMVMGK